jgi:mitotic spindle assembly checkpoint protein MAD1
MPEFTCPCGFKAFYKCRLIKHLSAKRKCKYLKDLEKNKNTNNIKSKKKQSKLDTVDDDNKLNNKIKEEGLKELDNKLILLKTFINKYESCNEKDKQLLLENDEYKEYIDLIMNYHPKDKNQNQVNNNTTNNNNITNNNTTNNITNNNQIINNNQITINNNINNNITVVYPFGFENIYFLSVEEMIDILTSNNYLIQAINKIYSNVENKNFMKRNMNREQMTVIDSSLDLQIFNDDVFKRKIIKHTFDSLKRMFYYCKDKLKIEHQIMLWQNLRILNESIKENMLMKKEQNMCDEIRQTMDTISNIISKENEKQNSRDRFMEIKSSMNNEEYKRLFNEKLNYIVAKMKEFTTDYTNRTITMDMVKNEIWRREPEKEQQLCLDNPKNDIRILDVKDTNRYMFFRDMEILENKYLDNEGNNTIGNIDVICDMREKIAEQEFEKYDEKFNLKITERKTLERKIKTEPKYKPRDTIEIYRKDIIKNLNQSLSNE